MNRLQQSRRQTFGYVYPPQVQNNIAKSTRYRNTYYVMEQSFDQSSQSGYDMTGEGIMDIARGLYDKGKEAGKFLTKAGKMASDLYASDIGKAVQNIIPSSDETARPGFAGEKHAILQLPNGKYGVANYMGPGTKVIKRLKRGDAPRTLSDKSAMRHDIDYALASGLKSKEEQIKAIREADKRMVKNLDRIAKNKSDNAKNIFMGRRLIQAKMAGEDLGLMPKASFAGKLKNISDEDKILLKSNQDKLGQAGYGNLPAQQLKLKLLKAHSKKMKKGKKGKGLKIPGMGLTVPGAGLGLPGAGLHMKNKKKIDMCITKKCRLMKGQGIVDIIKSVIKALTPMAKEIGAEAFKKVVVPYAVDKIKEKLQGKKGDGLRLAGQRGPRGKGLKLSGGRVSMGKSYGTTKGYPMKGKGMKGGFWFLAPLIALAAEAVSGVTVASVGSALATGAATAAGAAITKKIIGSGKMKGKGVKEVAQKVGQVLKKNKEKIIKVAESTGVLPKDLPKHILEKAQKALDVINEVSSGKPSKEKVLGVVKMIIPHVKDVFHAKMEKKMKGSGMCGGGDGFDKKVLNVVKKNL
jgi:hypothetical protein